MKQSMGASARRLEAVILLRGPAKLKRLGVRAKSKSTNKIQTRYFWNHLKRKEVWTSFQNLDTEKENIVLCSVTLCQTGFHWFCYWRWRTCHKIWQTQKTKLFTTDTDLCVVVLDLAADGSSAPHCVQRELIWPLRFLHFQRGLQKGRRNYRNITQSQWTNETAKTESNCSLKTYLATAQEEIKL